jgi:hypothetical protein
MDAHMVAATVAMFGHVLDRSRVQLAVAEILARAWAPEERCQIAGSLVTGLTYRMVMSGLNSGTVEPIPPHPGRTAAVGLMETWLDLEDYSPWSRLTLTLAASSLGMPGAIEQLRPVLDSALATEPSEESAAGSQAGQALEMLCAQGRAPTLTELEHFAVEGSYNFATRAIGVIAKGGTAAHAESLIDLFDRVRKDHRPTLLGALEPLAGRLGLRITMVGGKLVASGA